MTRLAFRKAALLSAALFAAGVVTGLAADPAHAQTVYDNGGPNSLPLYGSDPKIPQEEADTFTFTGTTTFNTVQWYGGYFNGNTPGVDNFTLSFYNTDTSGVPATAPFTTFTAGSQVNRTNTGIASGSSNDLYSYTATLAAPLSLGAGTYGLSIVNAVTGTSDFWGWNASRAGTHYFRQSAPAGFSTSSGGDLAFNLQNNATVSAVPEPSEYAAAGMFGATLLFGMVKARRKKVTQAA